MTFLERVLEPPTYGWVRPDGSLYVPTKREIITEFFNRMNVVRTRKNWLALFDWASTLSLAIPLAYFLTHYLTLAHVAIGFVYSMVIMGSHGTLWLHRYCTHRAYKFRNPFFRFLVRNAVIKIIPEEIYTVSHLVHHQFSEQPMDPYNVHGGWLYCFLADVNHQLIRRDLTEKEYAQLCRVMEHTGVRVNSYAQYQKWGSLCHPVNTILHFALNWAFWFGVFFLIGGMPLAFTIFASAGFWAIGVRTYNFEGHGKGKDQRQDGIDFNRADLSVNQLWPGYVAGEWHNNHHLYPNGARSGFLPYQFDLPWLWIRGLKALGAITSYRDYKEAFLRDHYEPYCKLHEQTAKGPAVESVEPLS